MNASANLVLVDDLQIEEMSWSGNDLNNVVSACFCLPPRRSRGLDAWLCITAPIDDDALVA
jgi:hypothetical protein